MIKRLALSGWFHIYLLLGLSYLICLAWLPYPLDFLHKSAAILLLAVWVWSTAVGTDKKWLLIAVLFSAVGDILLALPLANGFVYGLGAFLLSHLFYLTFFARYFRWQAGLIPLIAILIVAVTSLLSYLIPVLGDMLIPVLLYVSVISLMAISAIFTGYHPSSTNHKLLIIGALSFVISDSIIALNKFLFPVPYQSLLIMSSYYLAQYCLVTASIQLGKHRFATTA
ncbi:lysoplasmalogenase [Neptunicella sp. SCSIO 80796]|uniref:lysoplasmalogenase n=1 Tax=Neptunicella plasticusilytica TaxID=3117012 RepID=UPI003A4DC76B